MDKGREKLWRTCIYGEVFMTQTKMKQPSLFQEQLEMHAGMKLQLKINDNRSTMLSVKWLPDLTKVSLHRMFLEAPKNIMHELACYLRREYKSLTPNIKAYIETNIQKLDYSKELNPDLLSTLGRSYNLQKIYDQLNEEYFQGKLKLHITWFGKSKHRFRSRITFGLYHDPLKLIKINRILDHPSVPHYIVAYIIYHEMVHNACPAYVDERGVKHIHSKEFKQEEKKFRYYNEAQKWIKSNQEAFFNASFC